MTVREVKVTRTQIRAAKLLAERMRARGEQPPPGVLLVASAKPKGATMSVDRSKIKTGDTIKYRTKKGTVIEGVVRVADDRYRTLIVDDLEVAVLGSDEILEHKPAPLPLAIEDPYPHYKDLEWLRNDLSVIEDEDYDMFADIVRAYLDAKKAAAK